MTMVGIRSYWIVLDNFCRQELAPKILDSAAPRLFGLWRAALLCCHYSLLLFFISLWMFLDKRFGKMKTFSFFHYFDNKVRKADLFVCFCLVILGLQC